MQIRCSFGDSIIKIQGTGTEDKLSEQEISVAICGVWIACANVWEEICVHACRSKKSSGSRTFGSIYSEGNTFIIASHADLFSLKQVVEDATSGDMFEGDTIYLVSDIVLNVGYPQKDANGIATRGWKDGPADSHAITDHRENRPNIVRR